MKMTHPQSHLEMDVADHLVSSYESQGWRPATPQAPAADASLEEWQAFAREQELTDDDLDGKTRDELRAALS